MVHFLALTLLYLVDIGGQCSSLSSYPPSQQPSDGKPSNPCSKVDCKSPARCWWDPCTGEVKGCENRCQKNACPPGYSCTTVDKCSDQSCQPTVYCTRQPDACTNHSCKENEFCWYDRDCRPRCEDPCAKVRCKAGYKCRGEVGQCCNSTCPPKARCYSPCEYVRCPENSLCYSNTKDGKPTCLNPCRTAKCKSPNYICSTQQGSCNDYSCRPVPHCYNPCENVACEKGSICWFNGTHPVCENPCAYTDCLPTFFCRARPGDCGNGTCPPKADCYREYPPSSCDGIDCYGKGKCLLVNTLEYPSVPICGPNPCINPLHKCCSVRTSNGRSCNEDGCYLQFQNKTCTCKGEACQVTQVCRDPCRVENVRCPVGTFCYKDQVQCFAAPCNPVTTCRQPCNATYGSVCDPTNQKCEVIYVSCAGYDPYCKPIETCVRKNY